MITETAPVQEALDELREELGDRRVDFGELVIIGARAKLRELHAAGAAAKDARASLAVMVRTGSIPVDVDAADEVKRVRLTDARP